MAPPMMSDVDSISNSPFCGDLRSKKYFLMEALPQQEEEYLDPSGYCWCHHTQHSLGPDGDLALPAFCRPGRPCYRSALAPPT